MAVTKFWVELKETSVNQASNTSTVTATAYITTTNSYNLLNTANGKMTFSGNASGSYSFKAKFSTYSTTKVYSRTITVAHNEDGSGSVKVNVSFDTRVSAGTVTASASLTLTKIARASKPSVSGTKELGQELTITTNRASSSYTHTIKYSFAGYTGTIGTGIGASTKWTPQLAFANGIPNASSGTCTLTTTTYNGSSTVGTSTVSFTLSVPSSMNPTIDGVTVTDESGYLDSYGAYIGSKSVAKVSTSASAKYGASIKSYSVSIGSDTGTGSSASVPISFASEAQETRTVKVVVTDSRGRTATATRQITIIAFQMPDMTVMQVKRWNTTTDSEDDESTTARIFVTGTLMKGLEGKAQASATVSIKYCLKGETQYTELEDTSVSGYFTFTKDVEGMDSAKVYVFIITLTDSFGETATSGEILLPTAKPIMDFKADGTGMAFFGVSRFPGLHFNGNVTLTSSDGTGASILGFSGKETQYPIISTYPDYASPDEAPSMRIGGDYFSSESDYDRVWGLNLLWKDYLGGDIGFPIWTGTWSSGSVTIPDIQKYRLFMIYQGNSSGVDLDAILASRSYGYTDSFSICGIGGSPATTSNNNQNISAVRIDVSGTSCTLVRSHYVTHSSVSPYTHSSGQTRPIWQVVGLI